MLHYVNGSIEKYVLIKDFINIGINNNIHIQNMNLQPFNHQSIINLLHLKE